MASSSPDSVRANKQLRLASRGFHDLAARDDWTAQELVSVLESCPLDMASQASAYAVVYEALGAVCTVLPKVFLRAATGKLAFSHATLLSLLFRALYAKWGGPDFRDSGTCPYTRDAVQDPGSKDFDIVDLVTYTVARSLKSVIAASPSRTSLSTDVRAALLPLAVVAIRVFRVKDYDIVDGVGIIDQFIRLNLHTKEFLSISSDIMNQKPTSSVRGTPRKVKENLALTILNAVVESGADRAQLCGIAAEVLAIYYTKFITTTPPPWSFAQITELVKGGYDDAQSVRSCVVLFLQAIPSHTPDASALVPVFELACKRAARSTVYSEVLETIVPVFMRTLAVSPQLHQLAFSIDDSLLGVLQRFPVSHAVVQSLYTCYRTQAWLVDAATRRGKIVWLWQVATEAFASIDIRTIQSETQTKYLKWFAQNLLDILKLGLLTSKDLSESLVGNDEFWRALVDYIVLSGPRPNPLLGFMRVAATLLSFDSGDSPEMCDQMIAYGVFNTIFDILETIMSSDVKATLSGENGVCLDTDVFFLATSLILHRKETPVATRIANNFPRYAEMMKVLISPRCKQILDQRRAYHAYFSLLMADSYPGLLVPATSKSRNENNKPVEEATTLLLSASFWRFMAEYVLKRSKNKRFRLETEVEDMIEISLAAMWLLSVKMTAKKMPDAARHQLMVVAVAYAQTADGGISESAQAVLAWAKQLK